MPQSGRRASVLARRPPWAITLVISLVLVLVPAVSARANTFKSDAAHNVKPGANRTRTVSIQCDPGEVFLTTPRLQVSVGTANNPRFGVEGGDYIVGVNTVTAVSATYLVQVLTFSNAADRSGWDIDLSATCGAVKEKKPSPGKQIVTAFNALKGLSFYSRTATPVKKTTAPGFDAAVTPSNEIADPPTFVDGTKITLQNPVPLWCDFGSGKRLTVFDEKDGADYWYYPSADVRYDDLFPFDSSHPKPAVSWTTFQFQNPGGRWVPGCAKAAPNDASDRPMFFQVTLDSSVDCRWIPVLFYLIYCTTFRNPKWAATVSANTWGPTNPVGNPTDMKPNVIRADPWITLPSVSRQLGALLTDLQPFVYATPNGSMLGLFEAARDRNYVTLQDGTQVEQDHQPFVVAPGTTQLLLTDSNGDGKPEVNYIGLRADSATSELTVFNGVPGKWDVQRSTVAPADGRGDTDWLLTDPAVQTEPAAALELRSAADTSTGPVPAHSCIEIWPGSWNYATGQVACPQLNAQYQAVFNGAVDSNFASIFQMQPVPGRSDPDLVYFQSIVGDANELCLAQSGDTTVNLAPCNTQDGRQLWRLLHGDRTQRTDGAVEIQSVYNGRCIAPRKTANGVDAYLNCAISSSDPDWDYPWWHLVVPGTVGS